MLKRLLILTFTAWFAVLAFGWLWGVVVVLAVVLLLRPVSEWGYVKRTSQKMYERIEPSIIQHPVFKKVMPWLASSSPSFERAFHSREELSHTIERSGDILTPNEKMLLTGALSFRDKTVADIMTPKKQMVTVSASEFLGPLVLSELHATGHSRLPVIGKDIDHVVGVLYVQDLLSLNSKTSLTAQKAMDPKVHYVGIHDTLETALGIFLRSHHHLCIVLNDDGQTAGLVTIGDVIETLIGRKILDEDDPADTLG